LVKKKQKQKMKYLFLLLTIILAVSACEKNADLNCEAVNYDEVFVVEQGRSYCFSNDLQITIDSIENHFCPCFVRCIWGGEMLIQMTIEKGNEVIDYTLHGAKKNEALNLIEMEAFEVEFEEECTRSNPSPKIINAELKIRKL